MQRITQNLADENKPQEYGLSRNLENMMDLPRGKVYGEKIDIIAVTDTCKNFLSQSEIAGYQMFHKKMRKVAGGLHILLKHIEMSHKSFRRK